MSDPPGEPGIIIDRQSGLYLYFVSPRKIRGATYSEGCDKPKEYPFDQ
jgi:hypothetical protein